MLKTFIAAKVHGIRVTGLRHRYHGSQSMPASLLARLGIDPYEQVHIANCRNGRRWVTYALVGPEGECTLNGAAAHNGEVGDELIVMVYRQAERFPGARVAMMAADNSVAEEFTYGPPPGP